jgi:hypothetical protein
LLLKNPDIASYVRSLTYDVYSPISDHELNILDMLRKHSSLQYVKLLSRRWDWNDFSESMRSSLVSLIQLPTVTQFLIRSFEKFPATALSGCSNLIDLQLIDIELTPPEVHQIISRSKIPTPLSLYTNGGLLGVAALMNSTVLHTDCPIVDFSRLQKAEFTVKTRSDICQVNELIKETTRLEYLDIISE